MEESVAKLNISITVHQARIDSPIFSLILSPQVSLSFNSITVTTKVLHSPLPVWNETFDFEFTNSPCTLTLLNNPSFYKETTIGSVTFNIDKISGWFELTNNGKKVGAVRLTIDDDLDEVNMQKEYQKKIYEIQTTQEEVARMKKKYLKKFNKAKEAKKGQDIGEYSEELENLCISDKTEDIMRKKNEYDQKKILLKKQEENIQNEHAKIHQAWNDLKQERKELEGSISKIKEKYSEFRITKQKQNLQNRISEYSKQMSRTPKLSKDSRFSDSPSYFSRTQLNEKTNF